MEIKLNTREDKKKFVKIIPSSKDFIRHISENCIGCRNCVVVCSMDLWKIREGKAKIASDYREYCVECGSCFLACPTDAIEFTYPSNGEGVVFLHG